MNPVIRSALNTLTEKFGAEGFDSVVKFVIENEGAIMLDSNGAREGNEEADCTLYATAENFAQLLSGDLEPAPAYISAQLRVEGQIGIAIRLGKLLQ